MVAQPSVVPIYDCGERAAPPTTARSSASTAVWADCGLSLVPLFDGRMTERPRPIGFWHGGGGKDGGHAALTDNRYKLHKLGPGPYELYDLVDDPAEKKDLAAEKLATVASMRKALEAWQESVAKSLKGEDYRPAERKP